ncbi:molybdopterin-guanine dinucleotide biosynthesis protein B [Paraburkholderia caballeronis]|uniref:molybdopterin-guanine dinucleotide biosynthesis protein B n=1 Tax=Paraburkholderia caballeronis TaxID=416943 RepID=UPI001066335B|nr:molybdopterin-guanine dinucleotide biosynthesis protein B [Paraburkholderia caballeronis]TDV34135.1 molybdopterin-guanine dinucleotide biosynthesis protein B [Paraburkholderia caballeronis]
MSVLFGIVGRSGQGKTTLIEALLPRFRALGLKVNVVKHSHHVLEFEPPRKDSARFRTAGAAEVLIASPTGYAIVRELHGEPEPTLAELLGRLAPADLTLVEGYSRADMPRLEVVRSNSGLDVLYPGDSRIIAIASNVPVDTTLRCLPLDDPASIVAFICDLLGLQIRAAHRGELS